MLLASSDMITLASAVNFTYFIHTGVETYAYSTYQKEFFLTLACSGAIVLRVSPSFPVLNVVDILVLAGVCVSLVGANRPHFSPPTNVAEDPAAPRR